MIKKKWFGRVTPENIAAPPAATPPPAVAVPPQVRPQAMPRPVSSVPENKLRVLFLCIGNSCRSPMAEGLARKYGSDVMDAVSAGLMPIHQVDPFGVKVMQDRNIDISDIYPKAATDFDIPSFDLIVNMSGQKLPALTVQIEEWNVPDPIGQDEEAFRRTADLLEHMVMRLILQIRLKQHAAVSYARAER